MRSGFISILSWFVWNNSRCERVGAMSYQNKINLSGHLSSLPRRRRNAWQPLRTCAWKASIIVKSYAPCSPLCSSKNIMFYPLSGHHEIEFPITTLCGRFISAFCKILATLNFCLSHVFSSQKRFIFKKAFALSAKLVQFYGAVSGHSSSSSLSFPFLSGKSSSRSSSIFQSLPT